MAHSLIALDLDLKSRIKPIRGARIRTPNLRAVVAGATETDSIGVITMTQVRVTTITPVRGTVIKVTETKIFTDLIIRK